jgi:hypothetical protein
MRRDIHQTDLRRYLEETIWLSVSEDNKQCEKYQTDDEEDGRD